jgi:hypothetical protein
MLEGWYLISDRQIDDDDAAYVSFFPLLLTFSSFDFVSNAVAAFGTQVPARRSRYTGACKACRR